MSIYDQLKSLQLLTENITNKTKFNKEYKNIQYNKI